MNGDAINRRKGIWVNSRRISNIGDQMLFFIFTSLIQDIQKMLRSHVYLHQSSSRSLMPSFPLFQNFVSSKNIKPQPTIITVP